MFISSDFFKLQPKLISLSSFLQEGLYMCGSLPLIRGCDDWKPTSHLVNEIIHALDGRREKWKSYNIRLGCLMLYERKINCVIITLNWAFCYLQLKTFIFDIPSFWTAFLLEGSYCNLPYSPTAIFFFQMASKGSLLRYSSRSWY